MLWIHCPKGIVSSMIEGVCPCMPLGLSLCLSLSLLLSLSFACFVAMYVLCVYIFVFLCLCDVCIFFVSLCLHVCVFMCVCVCVMRVSLHLYVLEGTMGGHLGHISMKGCQFSLSASRGNQFLLWSRATLVERS